MNVTMEKFGYPHTLVAEFDHWTIQLRPSQVTLGSLALINKSEAKHLGELLEEEWTEFTVVSRFAEELLRRNFNAEKFNYLALMMKDPNVHFHLIPRYSQAQGFAGQTFNDIDWPNKTSLEKIEVSDEVFAQILEKLKEGVDI